MKKFVCAFIALVSLLCLIGWASSGQKEKTERYVWEYRIMPQPSEATLNELGRHGWELVSVVAHGDTAGHATVAYLKRAR